MSIEVNVPLDGATLSDSNKIELAWGNEILRLKQVVVASYNFDDNILPTGCSIAKWRADGQSFGTTYNYLTGAIQNQGFEVTGTGQSVAAWNGKGFKIDTTFTLDKDFVLQATIKDGASSDEDAVHHLIVYSDANNFAHFGLVFHPYANVYGYEYYMCVNGTITPVSRYSYSLSRTQTYTLKIEWVSNSKSFKCYIDNNLVIILNWNTATTSAVVGMGTATRFSNDVANSHWDNFLFMRGYPTDSPYASLAQVDLGSTKTINEADLLIPINFDGTTNGVVHVRRRIDGGAWSNWYSTSTDLPDHLVNVQDNEWAFASSGTINARTIDLEIKLNSDSSKQCVVGSPRIRGISVTGGGGGTKSKFAQPLGIVGGFK